MTHAPITTIYLVHVPADGAPTIINRDLEGAIHEGLFRSWVRDAANAMLAELKGTPLPEIPTVEPIARRVRLPAVEEYCPPLETICPTCGAKHVGRCSMHYCNSGEP